MKLRPRLITFVTAVGLTGLFALTPSAALANVNAQWNVSPNEAHWKGSLTVEREGFKSVTCSNLDMRVPLGNNPSKQGFADLSVGTMSGPMEISCAGETTLEIYREGLASFNGTNYQLDFWIESAGIYLGSPFGVYLDNALIHATGIVTNGNKETPSKVTFTKTEIGGGPGSGESAVTISGTLTMTTSSGGLLTLST